MTQVQNKTIVIDFLSLSSKNAALYFDYVVPIIPDSYALLKDEEAILHKITPDCFWAHHYGVTTRDYIAATYLRIDMPFHPNLQLDHLSPVQKTRDERVKFFCSTVIKFLSERSLLDNPTLFSQNEPIKTTIKQEDLLLTLANLKLVDTSRTTWDQIIEFRRDHNAVTKLRRLKQFLHTNFVGKDPTFIEDNLCMRLDDYENTVKDWGFETTTSTLSLLLSSKSLAGTASATLLSILFGAPTVAAASAISGAFIELGKTSLHLAKRRYGLKTIRRQHPIGYIIEAKQSLESKSEENKS